MICSSGIGFDPLHDGERLLFGFHGIWQGVAVLYDKRTKSRWLHLTGECVEGELKGARLKPISGRHVLWREWKQQHPDTQVMAENPRFKPRYFPLESAGRGMDFFPKEFLPTIQNRDKRFSLSALCYGVKTAKAARAYPFDVLAKVDGGVINDTVGDVPVVIVFDAITHSAAGHGRVLDGKTLEFERTENGLLREKASGSRFNLDGKAIEGTLKGRQLPAVFGLQAEWYGWYATYPSTTVWEPGS